MGGGLGTSSFGALQEGLDRRDPAGGAGQDPTDGLPFLGPSVCLSVCLSVCFFSFLYFFFSRFCSQARGRGDQSPP